MNNKNQHRVYFSEEKGNLTAADLTFIQKESWQWFLDEAISNELKEISPIEDFTGKNWELYLENPSLGEPTITSKKALEKGLTYSVPLKITATLVNKRNGKKVTQEVFLGEIPQMTSRGTFIISGVERSVVSQLVRSPGVYFSGELDSSSGRMLYHSEIRPLHGTWLEFEVSKNDVISARIDRRRKITASVLLRIFGVETNDEIQSLFKEVDKDPQHKYISSTLNRDLTTNKEEALLDFYRRMRPGEPVLLENAESLFRGMFLDHRRYDLGSVGRFKINKRLGLDIPNVKQNWVLTKEDIIFTLKYLIGLQNGEGKVDDIDHLANRRVRRVGELVSTNAFRVGLLRLERSIKEKMSLISPADNPTPSLLISARPLVASLNEFFRLSQLSAILDNTNPLSELDILRKLSVMGTGGINRERASFSIRDVSSSQYSRIDPVRTPEGQNIGLVNYLALYARVNNYGFIEAPYRKVEKIRKGGKTLVKVTDEIIYLPADDEEEYHITHCGVNIDKDGFITDERVAFRYKGSVLEGPTHLVDLIDVTPRQVVGASASLIPFLAHDEGNRALMGANMQCQAVPLIKPESPIVGTGMEGLIARGMGRLIESQFSGVVDYADAEKVVIRLDKETEDKGSEEVEISKDGKTATYFLTKFKKTSQSTCYNQRVVVKPGDRVEKGDVLADGPSMENGELALGRNLLIAYMSLDGYGFEDAILISDRLVKEDLMTSINIEEYEADVVETKLGPEELTRDIPNVAESELANLAEDGIVVVGAEVGPNDILVGKIAPKGETELTAEERLLRAIFGEKAREVRDTSLRLPHGERGIVVDVQILDREKGDELGAGVIKRVIVRVAQMRKITVGDKVAGRHGNKGVIAKVMPVADMPFLADGTPVDIIISPLSVVSRMNLGQLLECHLGWAAQKQGIKVALPVFDEIGEDRIVNELKKANLPVNGKARLFDGRTGEAFLEDTTVGIAYIIKLNHMVEDKTHARSTGPYSLVTQQPLGGKAQMGGQRLGEMEVWALEAHRAAYTLQEMLTIKSDDIVGRAKAFEAIVKGVDIPQSTVPESFKVLVRELNSLCLSIEASGRVSREEGEISEEVSELGLELEEASGAKEVAVASELLNPEGPMEVDETLPVEENN
ncbi:MAG: DNA-directed RNA polymerase subunit beta [Patescibacteria group bacterium]|nr:MAG: DNA-directed RNA polymerase subunit beta [Patescibacteria group bacterium]